MATNINARYAKVRVSTKPWNWYYDRLPRALRRALAASDHNWSDEVAYGLWKGCYGFEKRPVSDIIVLIMKNDAALAYNWMETDETI